jgi:hypothetical protein
MLVDTVRSMLDEFVRDYFVERCDAMLDSRIVNGYYTRLGLAPGQPFASKGGYLVRFAGPAGARVGRGRRVDRGGRGRRLGRAAR